MSRFQAVLYIVFGLLILVGVVLFAGFVPGTGPSSGAADLVMWGTLPEDSLTPIFDDFNSKFKDITRITYLQKDERTFEQELVEDLARGLGPDLVLITPALLARQGDKLVAMPNQAVSVRTFRDTFIDGAEIFLSADGALAMPFLVDPLVLYWNRDLFSGAGVPKVPSYWDEVLALPERLTVRDGKGNITRSAIALGGYKNISHAKDILSALFLQVGDPIAQPVFIEGGVRPDIVLGEGTNAAPSQADSALRFYTEFGNPAKKAYSWNSALRNSIEYFNAGLLAMYVGYASELTALRNGNPHLDLDVATIPQIRPAGQELPLTRTFGRIIGIGTLRNSRNVEKALQVSLLLSQADVAGIFSQALNIPPARRDLLSQEALDDPFTPVFNRSALSVQSWLDPSPSQTDTIFREMVEGVLIGGSTEGSLVRDARDRMQALVR